MDKRQALALLRIGFAALAMVAILVQMLDLAGKGVLNPVITMIRGAIVGSYPYPFLDPANGGYGAVLAYSLAILIGMLLFIYAIVWIGNAMRERREP